MNVEPEAPQAGGSLKIRLTGHDPEDDAISFEYRTGPNEPWQIAADGRVLLPELAEGPLAVEVRARDSGGRISEIVKRTLEVKRATPPPAVVPFSEKDARQHQEAWAKYIKRAVVETNSIGMKLVLIPPGRFMMGQGSDEAIIHEVTLTKAFYLADREVTVEQFQQFIEDSQYPATEKPQNWGGAHRWFSPEADCPVQQVSWFDAVLYCNWLSTREGHKLCYERTGKKEKIKWGNQEFEIDGWRRDFEADGYRLPTEAEWEYMGIRLPRRKFRRVLFRQRHSATEEIRLVL